MKRKKIWISVFSILVVFIFSATELAYGMNYEQYVKSELKERSTGDVLLYLADRGSPLKITLLNLAFPNLGNLFFGDPETYGVKRPSGLSFSWGAGYLAIFFYFMAMVEPGAEDVLVLPLIPHGLQVLVTGTIVNEFNESLERKYNIHQSQKNKDSKPAFKVKILEVRF